MGSAYSPGLTVSPDVVVQRMRRLPIKGEVLLAPGAAVEPGTIVARAMLPGALQTIRVSEKLGVEPREVADQILVAIGAEVVPGQLVAETKGLFGRMFKAKAESDVSGVVESISEVTGHMLVREPSIPVEMTAYVQGKIVQVMADEGALIETRGAMVQGIFGIGGERHGVIRVAVTSPNDVLEASHFLDSDAGKIIVGGSGVTLEALERAGTLGIVGLVVGAVRDVDLTKFLGYDIGVAITGEEQIGLTLICTEGFGRLHMADRTFKLLQSLEGRSASMNGATQIRAGVIRPELIAPNPGAEGTTAKQSAAYILDVGSPIRVIREPYFGLLGRVSELPAQLQTVESGAEVRVLRATLDDGRDVTVPRANVEVIAST